MTYKFEDGEKVGIRGISAKGVVVARRFALFSLKHKTFFPARYYILLNPDINGVKYEEREDDLESLAEREKRGTWKDEVYNRKRYGGIVCKRGIEEDFIKYGTLPEDHEKSDDILRYAYHLARAHNHHRRVYYVGMILRDRLISYLEQRSEQKGVWNWIQTKRLQRQLRRLEDGLYIANHMASGHLVPFEKYEFMQEREREGDMILDEDLQSLGILENE